jgi:hypothetical protein
MLCLVLIPSEDTEPTGWEIRMHCEKLASFQTVTKNSKSLMFRYSG